jgi:ABC-type molybdate transport system substrate-binding protein
VYASDAMVYKNKINVALSIPVPQGITFMVAPLQRSQQQTLADTFIRFLRSEEAQQILVTYGFLSYTQEG